MFGFDIFSSAFGYALGFLFDLTANYGVSIILFTLIINIIFFPVAIKRVRGMSTNEKFEAKKEELKKRCGKDIQRFNRELMELAQKEGVNPMKGCTNISFILTLIIFSGIYSTIQKPLSNVLHLSKEKISQATSKLTEEQKRQKGSDQLDLVRSFEEIKPELDMLTEDELDKISRFSKGFEFLGVNLLNIPKFSKFSEMLWILPLLSFLFSALGTFIMQKNSGLSDNASGIGKYSVYLFAVFQAWIVSQVFAALGLYLLFSNILGNLQSIIIDRFFSTYAIKAKQELKLFEELKN
ncbi:MAG: membrane protein insertase YidC [Clostridia bacterium]|nr:membrane protein insertase YidC [Clostridia bacterium]